VGAALDGNLCIMGVEVFLPIWQKGRQQRFSLFSLLAPIYKFVWQTSFIESPQW